MERTVVGGFERVGMGWDDMRVLLFLCFEVGMWGKNSEFSLRNHRVKQSRIEETSCLSIWRTRNASQSQINPKQ